MPFVLDASIAACWVFQDEHDRRAQSAWERVRDDDALVSALWWFEVRNMLVVNERRKRITEQQTGRFLTELSLMRVITDFEPNEKDLLALARTRRLTVYDASYLELAKRHGVTLATLDAELMRAARAEKVALLGS